MLTQAQVRKWFDYDPTTGVLRWRIRPANAVQVGDRAGSNIYDKHGKPFKRVVGFDNYTSYTEAHVIWLWMTGVWPTKLIDHANLDRFDNSWSNLREATDSENSANGPSRHAGLKWTNLEKNGRYRSRVRWQGVLHNVGTFHTEQEAHDAAYALAQQLHGQFSRKA